MSDHKPRPVRTTDGIVCAECGVKTFTGPGFTIHDPAAEKLATLTAERDAALTENRRLAAKVERLTSRGIEDLRDENRRLTEALEQAKAQLLADHHDVDFKNVDGDDDSGCSCGERGCGVWRLIEDVIDLALLDEVERLEAEVCRCRWTSGLGTISPFCPVHGPLYKDDAERNAELTAKNRRLTEALNDLIEDLAGGRSPTQITRTLREDAEPGESWADTLVRIRTEGEG